MTSRKLACALLVATVAGCAHVGTARLRLRCCVGFDRPGGRCERTPRRKGRPGRRRRRHLRRVGRRRTIHGGRDPPHHRPGRRSERLLRPRRPRRRPPTRRADRRSGLPRALPRLTAPRPLSMPPQVVAAGRGWAFPASHARGMAIAVPGPRFWIVREVPYAANLVCAVRGHGRADSGGDEVDRRRELGRGGRPARTADSWRGSKRRRISRTTASQVDVDDGIAVLEGTVDSEREKKEAQQLPMSTASWA